jgi:4-amino-4-deoxy-L-arabinose transferase-like glycosyltransferase
MARSTLSPRFFFWAMVGVTLAATALRLWQLPATPPGLWFDEAYNGMDAVWMMRQNEWPVFLVGNNGREAMFHYLLASSIAVLGETAYAIRIVPAVLGIVTIPLMYRWGVTLFGKTDDGRWLALLGALGMATSFWVLVMNRSGYRANLLPLFVILSTGFFWKGWQSGQWRYYTLAGVALGLSQYTYLSARLLPLVFLLFVVIQTILPGLPDRTALKSAWLGLILMAATLTILPLVLLRHQLVRLLLFLPQVNLPQRLQLALPHWSLLQLLRSLILMLTSWMGSTLQAAQSLAQVIRRRSPIKL